MKHLIRFSDDDMILLYETDPQLHIWHILVLKT